MLPHMPTKVIFLCCSLLLIACSDDEPSNDNADAGNDTADANMDATCAGMCQTAGFDDGTEVDYGAGVIECTCQGEGDGIAEAACDSYCEPHGVDAANALLSTEVTANDKCVCDGTQ